MEGLFIFLNALNRRIIMCELFRKSAVTVLVRISHSETSAAVLFACTSFSMERSELACFSVYVSDRSVVNSMIEMLFSRAHSSCQNFAFPTDSDSLD